MPHKWPWEPEMAEGDGDEKASASTPAVFISYASQDVVVANAVIEALERHGAKCWIAPRDVVPGAFYAGAIVHAIDAAKVIVLVLSGNAATSQHVLREVERASSKRHPVVALRIDLAPMPADLEYFLNTSHWLDASAGDVEHALPKLVDAVQRAMAGTTVASPGDTGAATKPVANLTQQPPIAGATSRRLKPATLALSIFMAVGLGYFAADKLWFSKRTANERTLAIAAPPAPPAGTAVPEKSIAVLPFADMSEKHDQEYFADGMAEEVLDLLAKIPDLKVISRTSSFQFKGKNQDLRTVGSALGVSYVVEGSVRRSGERLRVTAQLINALEGSHLWSDTYDEPVGDTLRVQDQIAGSLVRALQVTVGADYQQARPSFKNVEAYDLYLRGRHAIDKWDKEGFESAATYFQQVLELDPTSVPAVEWLAFVQEGSAEFGYVEPREGFEQARRSAQRALGKL